MAKELLHEIVATDVRPFARETVGRVIAQENVHFREQFALDAVPLEFVNGPSQSNKPVTKFQRVEEVCR